MLVSAASSVSGSNWSNAYASPIQQQPQNKPSTKASGADTVTISKQAQQLASDGDTAAQEFSESYAEKASETLKGKK